MNQLSFSLRRIQTRSFVALFAAVILMTSCRNAVDPVSNSCERASKLAEDYQKAVQAYSTSQTKANCDAFKKAGNEFLTAAGRCASVSQAEINEAKQDLANFTCE